MDTIPIPPEELQACPELHAWFSMALANLLPKNTHADGSYTPHQCVFGPSRIGFAGEDFSSGAVESLPPTILTRISAARAFYQSETGKEGRFNYVAFRIFFADQKFDWLGFRRDILPGSAPEQVMWVGLKGCTRIRTADPSEQGLPTIKEVLLHQDGLAVVNERHLSNHVFSIEPVPSTSEYAIQLGLGTYAQTSARPRLQQTAAADSDSSYRDVMGLRLRQADEEMRAFGWPAPIDILQEAEKAEKAGKGSGKMRVRRKRPANLWGILK